MAPLLLPSSKPLPLERRGSTYWSLSATEHQIRILNIVSAEPLKCSFERISLKTGSNEGYEAISWAWGDSTRRAQIEVDDVIIDIPAGALQVLTKLCVAHQHRRVWIDAVCINQNDVQERNEQVSIMDEIYAHATKTLVWLGDDDIATKQALSSMNALLQWRNTRHRTDCVDGCSAWCDRKVGDAFRRNTDWQAISTFFSATWFSRFWVVQEVALSAHADVFQGAHECCWDLIAQVAQHIVVHFDDLPDELQSGLTGILNAHSINVIRRGGRADLLLDQGHTFGATDPRDRAFALYGLLKRPNESTTLRQAFLPDYSKGLAQIYTAITKAAIEDAPARGLFLLTTPRTVPRHEAQVENETFPSWVPRYDQIQDYLRGSSARVGIGHSRRACLDTQAEILGSPEEELCLAGFLVDTIELIAGIVEPEPYGEDQGQPVIPASLLTTLRVLWNAVLSANPTIPKLQLSAHLSETLITGSYTPDDAEQLMRRYGTFVARYWALPRPPVRPQRVVTHESEHSQQSHTSDGTDDSDGYEFYMAHGHVEDLQSDDEELISGSDATYDSSSTDSSDHEQGLYGPDDRARQSERELRDAESYLNDVLTYSANRLFFVSKSGRMGSVPSKGQQGDCIAILCGLPVPVVLRPHGEHYEFIGDAYLNGIMTGEFLDELLASHAYEEAKQWFRLR